MTPLLSILICTIPERSALFAKLLSHISDQIAVDGNRAEVLFDDRPKGALSVGAKRQALLERAQGDYVCFVDDDDWVSNAYVKRLCDACKAGTDCVGFKIHCNFDRQRTAMASASLKYAKWGDNVDGFRYVRSPYHKTPVKRSIALQVGFQDKRYAEDYDYSVRLYPLLKTEQYINEVMYFYRYTTENHNKKYGIN